MPEICSTTSVFLSVLDAIEVALQMTGSSSPSRILDFACGHGRVLRILRARFPKAKIVACDIDKDAVEFCADQFQAEPLSGVIPPEETRIEDKFDLIWCGSLLTHLSALHWGPVLRMWSDALAEGGIMIFTTHGRKVIARMRAGISYGVDSGLSQLFADYERKGFGFFDYEGEKGYGIFVSAPSWVVAQLEKSDELRLLYYEEACWDDHQDVVAYVRDWSRRSKSLNWVDPSSLEV